MTTKTKRPSRDGLAEYFARDKQIAELRRQANDLAKLQGAFEDQALAYVKENGGPERVSIVCGYRLVIQAVAKRVEWQKALMIELAGAIGDQQAAARAEAIRKAAGTKDEITIEPPS